MAWSRARSPGSDEVGITCRADLSPSRRAPFVGTSPWNLTGRLVGLRRLSVVAAFGVGDVCHSCRELGALVWRGPQRMGDSEWVNFLRRPTGPFVVRAVDRVVMPDAERPLRRTLGRGLGGVARPPGPFIMMSGAAVAVSTGWRKSKPRRARHLPPHSAI